MKNILLLIDGQGWVLDRIAYGIVEKLKHKYNFDLIPYTQITTWQYLNIANNYDLVHYQNWNITIPEALSASKTPVIISIKSHRYPESFVEFVKNNPQIQLVGITPQICEKFPKSIYIPDPVFDGFEPKHEFTVGTTYQNEPKNIIYKGVPIIREACKQLGCNLSEVSNLPPEKMMDWYNSIDLYVCMSENEAMNTPVMECLMMNKPVITTNVGIPAFFNIHKCERNLESLKNMISRFYTYPQAKYFNWTTTINGLDQLYSGNY